MWLERIRMCGACLLTFQLACGELRRCMRMYQRYVTVTCVTFTTNLKIIVNCRFHLFKTCSPSGQGNYLLKAATAQSTNWGLIHFLQKLPVSINLFSPSLLFITIIALWKHSTNSTWQHSIYFNFVCFAIVQHPSQSVALYCLHDWSSMLVCI